MTSEVDIMKMAVLQYENAIRLKRMNENLYDQLVGSIIWLLEYSEKNNISLPKRETLYHLIERSQFLIDQIVNSTSPTKS